ncbi:MAG: PAS domain-containing protein [Planctomycetota bacterium]|jgi:PAS domain S-box-containing protein
MKKAIEYNPRILVVDDEEAILEEFQEILCPSTEPSKSERKLDELKAQLSEPVQKALPPSCSFDLVTCRQGDEAVEKARAAIEEGTPFVIVFLDVRMPPGPDGIWTAENIRALDPDAQLVIVTAYSDIDPLDIGRRVLPTDKLLYIQKPFHPHEIRQTASALWAKWLAEKQLKKQAVELASSNEQLRNEIAEHKRTEEKRLLLSSAVENTQDCVYVTDIKNKIIFINKAFCETYGYNQEEIMGKDSSILWPDKEDNEHIRSVFQILRDTSRVAFDHRRKDGTIFPVSLSRSLVKDAQGKDVAVVGLLHDVSAYIEIENALARENLQLKEQNELTRGSVTLALEEVRDALDSLKGIICGADIGAIDKLDGHIRLSIELAEESIARAAETIADLRNPSDVAGVTAERAMR